ncbi:serine/arginine repetitive matrix protein 5-like [Sitodiplosis mosellana]|uniref:serine/arginine repetitive matrix protein 5-like n=1 Tax=Sitodiplosis mosellana TaxID=263140 RepID=UPI002444E1B0|nr:serine/arginine repetitive matrix protein 5-like [Sitodiplosis mosellana]XP_055298569.1 serine/arginine repetitive matrix protein 5-like [Sitodiplosis mosellana]
MSHRSRRSDDRDRSHSSSQRYEHHHRRDDSRDRDYYHSRKSSRRDKSRSRYRNSRSRSPSHNGSKSYSRHHRHSRSRSPGYSSRHHRSRSRSQGHYSSRHNDDYHRSHRSKELTESKVRRDSREQSQTKHSTVPHEMFAVNHSTKSQNPTMHQTTNERGPMCISNQINDNSQGNDYYASDEPKAVPIDPNDSDTVLEEERKRIQRETLERLQKHLESEGKKYPAPRPQASHPIFANDGSFLEMFKSMQGNMQQQQQIQQTQTPQPATADVQPKPSVPTTSTAMNPTNRIQPINRRRGAKILKTGIVQKQRVIEEPGEEAAPSDSWNAYLKEVKRYKTVTCSDDNITRSLVK